MTKNRRIAILVVILGTCIAYLVYRGPASIVEFKEILASSSLEGQVSKKARGIAYNVSRYTPAIHAALLNPENSAEVIDAISNFRTDLEGRQSSVEEHMSELFDQRDFYTNQILQDRLEATSAAANIYFGYVKSVESGEVEPKTEDEFYITSGLYTLEKQYVLALQELANTLEEQMD